MKLIEKKCPNCGANLEFNETDKSCKCEYCHRAFEIERDEKKEDEYNLNTIKPIKNSIIVILIISFLIFAAFFALMLPKTKHSSTSNNGTRSNLKDKVSYFTDVSELTNSDLEDIDHDATMIIKNIAEGPITNHSYTKEGDQVRKKIYVASKEDGNIIVSVYEVKYYDFFNPENRYTVYIPIKYENIDKNQFVDKFSNPKVTAPKYYFDSDNTCSIYAYSNIDELYTNVIKPLKKEYKITEK